MPFPATPIHRPARDGRLDFWRALCLLDMLLVHLVYDGVQFGPFQRFFGDYTRFAAGGFVFVAGLSVGAIFLPRSLKPGGRSKAYTALWRRSLYVLGVHFAATFSFLALDEIRGYRFARTITPGTVRDVFLLREGGDLLPFYVIVLLISPLFLEIVRRGWGLLLGVLSIAVFILGQHHPVPSSSLQQNFPVLLWQAPFVFGLLFGTVLPQFTAFSSNKKIALAGAPILFSAAIWALDFSTDFGVQLPMFGLEFHKLPLSGGELLRYLGIIFSILTVTDLAWSRIAASRAVAIISVFGRRSLAVYVAHVWVVGLTTNLSWSLPGMGAWQSLLAVPAAVVLWFVATSCEWLDAWFKTLPSPQTIYAHVLRLARLPATTVAALGLLLVVDLFPRAEEQPPENLQAIALPQEVTETSPPVYTDVEIPQTDLDTFPGHVLDPIDLFDLPDTANIIPA